MGVQTSLRDPVFISFGCVPEVALLDHIVGHIFNFFEKWRHLILYSLSPEWGGFYGLTVGNRHYSQLCEFWMLFPLPFQAVFLGHVMTARGRSSACFQASLCAALSPVLCPVNSSCLGLLKLCSVSSAQGAGLALLSSSLCGLKTRQTKLGLILELTSFISHSSRTTVAQCLFSRKQCFIYFS